MTLMKVFLITNGDEGFTQHADAFSNKSSGNPTKEAERSTGTAWVPETAIAEDDRI
jgi:hypothetical protein